MDNIDIFTDLRYQLSDAPSDIKSAYNTLVTYFSDATVGNYKTKATFTAVQYNGSNLGQIQSILASRNYTIWEKSGNLLKFGNTQKDLHTISVGDYIYTDPEHDGWNIINEKDFKKMFIKIY